MFGIFKRVFSNPKSEKEWSAPDHWTHDEHYLSYRRQKDEAAKRRAALMIQTRLPF